MMNIPAYMEFSIGARLKPGENVGYTAKTVSTVFRDSTHPE
jgi:hypothetical protein